MGLVAVLFNARGAHARPGGLPALLAEKLLEPQGPSHDGTGCPAEKGGVAVSVTPDGQTLSILFDNFHSEVTTGLKPLNAKWRPAVDRRFCEIRVPVDLPAGYSLNVFRADYRGFAYTIGKTEGAVTSSVRLSDRKKPVSATHFVPAADEPFDYMFTHEIAETKDKRFACGEARTREITIRVDLSLMSGNTLGQTAMLTLDSIDGTREDKAGVRYALDWQPCKALKR